MILKFSTKAKTLSLLQGRLKSARIAPLVCFSVADWQTDRERCLVLVTSTFGQAPLIVRSSCQREDNCNESNAGAFLSLNNVMLETLGTSIAQVVAAYGAFCAEDEILIQPMLQNVVIAGVAFSHDPNTCAPYRVVNWSEGRNTALVTGGLGGRTWQQAAESTSQIPEGLANVVELLEELLILFANVPVDCEFAITNDEHGDVLWLLQARQLLLSRKPESNERQTERLKRIQKKIECGMKPHPFLIGQRTVYGVMPDWNPAEIIGIRPKPLALSLYRALITDAIWAYQRHNYGYRNLRSFPLMPHFFGLPYIDLRLSFNSFIPADLEEGLAGRLVDHYIDRLLSEPTLHDKIEFEVVFSCYSFDLPGRLERLEKVGFSKTERDLIAESLRRLTNRIFHPDDGLWRSDIAKLDILNSRREKLLASDVDTLGRIYWLIEDAKRYGTLPFAGLARAGFVAVQILKSLVAVGIFSVDDYEAFIGSVFTVNKQMARDRKVLDKANFLSRYGHLRPGTYDILSPRYDEAPDLYFDWSQSFKISGPQKPFSFTLLQIKELEKLLKLHGLYPDPMSLIDFLKAGIEMRELAKFHFTRNLSDALVLITKCGEQWGINREDLAFCDISAFMELYIAAGNPKEIILHFIEQGKERYQESQAVSLPPLIANPRDIWAFEWPETEPNYITQKHVTAHVVHCDDRDHLAGGLVCIPSADPGFDWLFSYPISGLITAWGGVNSHMAIRAGELGLPAVIGAGEKLYRQWANAKRLHLDCAERRVEILA